MTDYIKREDAKELFEMILESYKDAGIQNISMIVSIAPPEFHMSEDEEVAEFNSELDGWRNDFMKIEPADVAPIIHGDWKEQKITFNKWGGDVVTGKTLWRCSVCGHEDSILTNYCSKCGARMDGEEDEIDRRRCAY